MRTEEELKKAHEQLKKAHEELMVSLRVLEERNREIHQFGQMTELLQSCQTPQEGCTLIARFGEQFFPSEPGGLYLLNASRKLVEAGAAWGESLKSQEIFGPDDCWALRLGKLHVVESGRSPILCKHLTQIPTAGYLCVPMMAQGEVFAILHIEMEESTLAMTEELQKSVRQARQQMAVAFVEHAALSLANLKLREQLRLQSIRDPLTGLFNRSYLEESLERELSRASRNQCPLGIIMLDIDHFKKFNDDFGHDAGDSILWEIGFFLKKQCRQHDIACRYGGEEFVLIYPDSSLEDAGARAEQIRLQARDIRVKHQGRLLGPITLSLGVVAFPQHGANPVALLKEADEALYSAKSQGRDRVVVR